MAQPYQFPMRALAVASALIAAPLLSLAAPVVSLTAFEALGSASGPGTDVMDSVNATGGDFFRSNSNASGSIFFHT